MESTQYLVDQGMVALIVAMFAVTILVMVVIGIVWWLGSNRTNRIEERIARQLEEWAEEDLELKRARLTSTVQVDDSAAWLSRIITRATGAAVRVCRVADPSAAEPKYIHAEDDRGNRYLLSATTPDGLARLRRPWRWGGRSRLDRFGARHPLLPLARGSERKRLSTLNCGLLFDLEAAQVWERMHKEPLLMREMWLYVLPPLAGSRPG